MATKSKKSTFCRLIDFSDVKTKGMKEDLRDKSNCRGKHYLNLGPALKNKQFKHLKQAAGWGSRPV
jgi:hypothetical protein